MVKTKVLLNTIQKVRDFSEIVPKYNFDMDLATGRYVIDAKSITGIFSLNLFEELTLTIHADSEDPRTGELMKEISEFIV